MYTPFFPQSGLYRKCRDGSFLSGVFVYNHGEKCERISLVCLLKSVSTFWIFGKTGGNKRRNKRSQHTQRKLQWVTLWRGVEKNQKQDLNQGIYNLYCSAGKCPRMQNVYDTGNSKWWWYLPHKHDRHFTINWHGLRKIISREAFHTL